VTHPKRGEITRFVTLPGTIRANQQATVYAKVAGYLKTLSVDKGDSVKQDQVFGDIEVPELVADIAKNEADMEVAQIEFDRVTGAAKKAPDLVTAQALSEAEGKRKVAQARLEQAKTMLKYSKLTAPFGGIVTQRFVDPGAFISAPTGGGVTPAAAIVTIADFQIVRVQASVPEVEASFIKNGEPVKFSVDGLPGKNFDASISRFSYALDEVTRTMLIEADVPNQDLQLRPGMYAITRIGVEKKSDALLVPAEAIVMEKANAFVFLFAEGKAKKTAVKLGFNDGTNAEIVSGATEKDRVLVVGKTALNDGQAINAKESP